MSVEGEEERKIPVFTVTKNGAILKNIFVVNQSEGENRDGEEILTVGRHPDCHVMLTHPSISRFHLQILSNSSAQKLSVIDLASGNVISTSLFASVASFDSRFGLSTWDLGFGEEAGSESAYGAK